MLVPDERIGRASIQIDARPCCRRRLSTPRLPSPGYPIAPVTLGEQLRKRRADLGLQQKTVAAQLGVDATTLRDWERDRAQPRLDHLPAVCAFTGVALDVVTTSMPERLRSWRRHHGHSQEALARLLKVSRATVERLEASATHRATPRVLAVLSRILGLECVRP